MIRNQSFFETPGPAGYIGMLIVLIGLALGHSTVVLQWELAGGIGVIDTLVSMTFGITGVILVWVGLKKEENTATLLGYLGGNLIWVGFFEWTWHYFGHWLQLEPIRDAGFEIISPGLQMIQSTVLLVIVLLIFFGSNKDTRCRMFMWFHRNFRLRPGRMTAGYKRQHARTTAIETVFLIWIIYQFAIVINDPRLIRYDSTAAIVITVGFVFWGLYLTNKLRRIRGFGPAFRYAIPTASILWLPIESFSRWGLYPEIWIKPMQYPGLMLFALAVFVLVVGYIFRASDNSPESETVPA